MQVNQHYTQLIQELKFRIGQSRYIASRLVNREQLMLYYYIGKLPFFVKKSMMQLYNTLLEI